MNIFTFGKARLYLWVTVIGLPISLDRCGYSGSLERLITDYRRRKGLFLILNMAQGQKLPADMKAVFTLGTCIFDVSFSSFDQYLGALRSSYRRRVLQALEKGKSLVVKGMDASQMSKAVYDLYVQVLERSKYALETLDLSFFHRLEGQLYVFEQDQRPLAFFCVKQVDSCLHFLFGGMDYQQRDRYDLYYNMLLAMVRLGIEGGYQTIDFGQTAESSKCRVGCRIEPLYMTAFMSNRWLHKGVQALLPLLAYPCTQKPLHVFRQGEHVGCLWQE